MAGTMIINNGAYVNLPDVPRVNPEIRRDNKVTTPEWMVSIDDILSSTIDNYTDHAELFGWLAESARTTTGYTGNQLFTTATVQHSDPIIIIPNADYAAVLEDKLNTGATIALIKIVRLANITDLNLAIQTIEYKRCKFQTFQQRFDEIVLTFRPEARTNTIIKYKQDGTKEGQNASTFDFTTGKTE